MKIELGKFYETRNGEKVSVVEIRGDIAKLSNGDSVWVEIGTRWKKNPWFQEEATDLISEWKEETVSEHKFKIGDKIVPNRKEWRIIGGRDSEMYEHWNDYWSRLGRVSHDDVFYVIGFPQPNHIRYSNSPNGREGKGRKQSVILLPLPNRLRQKSQSIVDGPTLVRNQRLLKLSI